MKDRKDEERDRDTRGAEGGGGELSTHLHVAGRTRMIIIDE